MARFISHAALHQKHSYKLENAFILLPKIYIFLINTFSNPTETFLLWLQIVKILHLCIHDCVIIQQISLVLKRTQTFREMMLFFLF